MTTANGANCQLCARPSGDNAYTCTRCAETLSAALHEITGDGRTHGLAEDLDIALAKQGTKPERDGARTKASEAPLPIDVRASEAAGVLRNTLATWVRVVHEDQPKPLPADTLPAMASWLLPLCGWLRGRDYGPECIDEITAAVTQARRAVDLRVRRIPIPTPCPTVELDGDTPYPCGGALYALIAPGLPIDGQIRCENDRGHDTTVEQWEWRRKQGRRVLRHLTNRANLAS
ncbi:hypothetical protein GCM10023224_05210 [Streptomonospora halophila]|uniref:Uncharacterized protein n=1 Tax=Streptomonospora halophila TaxID=427369 RepID=A0ABP9G5S6_9ACTN